MAFREVTMLEVKEILRLWLTGVPKKEVARQLSLDVKAVRRYLAAAKMRGVEAGHGPAALDDELVAGVLTETQPATGRPRGDGWATCETHREFIAQHLVLRRRGVVKSPVREFQQVSVTRSNGSSRPWSGSARARARVPGPEVP